MEKKAVLDEIGKNTKHKKKTVHKSFFGLEDAFGSVSHSFIFETVQINCMKENI